MSWLDPAFRLFEYWRRRPRLRVESTIRLRRVPNTGFGSHALYRPKLYLRIVNLSSADVVITHACAQERESQTAYELGDPVRLKPRGVAKIELDVGQPKPDVPLVNSERAWLKDSTGGEHELNDLFELKSELGFLGEERSGWRDSGTTR